MGIYWTFWVILKKNLVLVWFSRYKIKDLLMLIKQILARIWFWLVPNQELLGVLSLERWHDWSTFTQILLCKFKRYVSRDSTDTNGPNPTCWGRMKIANPNYTSRNIIRMSAGTNINGHNPTCWGCLNQNRLLFANY